MRLAQGECLGASARLPQMPVTLGQLGPLVKVVDNAREVQYNPLWMGARVGALLEEHTW
jgi:hypothetical protein